MECLKKMKFLRNKKLNNIVEKLLLAFIKIELMDY